MNLQFRVDAEGVIFAGTFHLRRVGDSTSRTPEVHAAESTGPGLLTLPDIESQYSVKHEIRVCGSAVSTGSIAGDEHRANGSSAGPTGHESASYRANSRAFPIVQARLG
jgi:hypothetical protein